MKVQRRRQYGVRRHPYAGAVRSGLSLAAGLAYKGLGSYVKSRLGSARESAPITNQFDARLRYKRKPMPKARRLRWKKFSGKVKHVMLQATPLQNYVCDNLGGVQTAATDQQNTFSAILGGTQVTNNDELMRIFFQQFGVATAALCAPYVLYVKSMSLDIQITNTGTSRAVIDVYTVMCRKSYELSSQIADQYNLLFNEQSNLGGRSSTHPATTPFQNPLFCKYWRITKKSEIILGAGNYTTLQMRIPYNKKIYGRQIISFPQGIPGISRGYLFQVRGAPEDNLGSARLASATVTWKAQTTVNYCRPPGDTDMGAGST